MAGGEGEARGVTDDLLNGIVFSTEWDIARAGNPVRTFDAGLATHDCDRWDLTGSHVAWVRRPLEVLEVHPPPCPHPFEYLCASESEGREFLPQGSTRAKRSLALW